MSNLTDNVDIKAWGASGTLWPDGKKFDDIEAPKYQHANKMFYEAAKFMQEAPPIIDSRLESGTATAYPGDPETGELCWRSDTVRLSIYETGSSRWRGLLFKDEFDGHLSGDNPHGTALSHVTDAGAVTSTEVALDGGATIDGESVTTEEWVTANAPAVTSVEQDGNPLDSRSDYLNFTGGLSATSQPDGGVNVKMGSHNHDDRYYTESEVDSIVSRDPSDETYVEVRSNDPSNPETGRTWVVE